MNVAQEIVSNANRYNVKEFIASDPICFPHRYNDKKDIEISAMISSWIAYGNRKAILKTLSMLHQQMGDSPYEYISGRRFDMYKNDIRALYRFYKYHDFYILCSVLYQIYIERKSKSLEDYIINDIIDNAQKEITCIGVIESIVRVFNGVEGIPINTKSACKRLCMMLRWLVRNDGVVDLGLWSLIEPKDLIIPVDTHVHNIALRLGITTRKQADMKTALEITDYLKTVFPLDPTLGDFALFGFGVNN